MSRADRRQAHIFALLVISTQSKERSSYTNLWQRTTNVSPGHFHHCSYGHDVPFLFNQRLSDLEIIDDMSELGNYPKHMLLDKVTNKIHLFGSVGGLSWNKSR